MAKEPARVVVTGAAGICEGQEGNPPAKPTSDKELTIWALIAVSVNEEVSHHISSFSNAYEALSKLKELYDSHSEPEIVQLMIKLFSLEMKNDDPLAFGKMIVPSSFEEVAYVAHREKNHAPDSSKRRGGKRKRGRRQSDKSDLHCMRCNKDGHDAIKCRTPWDEIEQQSNQDKGKGKTNDKDKGKGKTNDKDKGKAPKDSFDASFTSRRDDWLLDSGASCHMTFRKDFFEEFTDKVDVAEVYFADKSKLKPSGFGTVRLKLPGLPDYILRKVLYFPELKINLLSLVQIRQQGHFINWFNGKVEVRKESDRSLVMEGIEIRTLLMLQGSSARVQKFASSSHHDEGQIGYALVPVILHMLDIPPAAEALNGVKMELIDAAFPLLKGIVATTDPVEACSGVNIAVMVGGFPRKEGMERKDVMSKNVSIYKSQASALQEHAAQNCKVLVVANPANTNVLILKEFAPSIPEKNITCLTRLDHNRALGQISERLHVPVSHVKNVIIWGNHSSSQYPDVYHASVVTGAGEKPVRGLVADDAWLDGEFITTVQQRGAAIIKARKLSSALSAASSACDHIRDWVLGTPKGTWVSMGVYSDGSYDVPPGIIFSYPVTCEDGNWSIVQGLPINEFSRKKLDATANELVEEKALAYSCLN